MSSVVALSLLIKGQDNNDVNQCCDVLLLKKVVALADTLGGDSDERDQEK